MSSRSSPDPALAFLSRGAHDSGMQSQRLGAGQATARPRSLGNRLRFLLLSHVATIAFLFYFFVDVQLRIAALPRVIVFV
jgi:hypothetical protein